MYDDITVSSYPWRHMKDLHMHMLINIAIAKSEESYSTSVVVYQLLSI